MDVYIRVDGKRVTIGGPCGGYAKAEFVTLKGRTVVLVVGGVFIKNIEKVASPIVIGVPIASEFVGCR